MDGCAYPMRNPDTKELIKKEWLIATSDPFLETTLGRKCSNKHGSVHNHIHEPIQGKMTESTAAYPFQMCKKWADQIMKQPEWSTWCAWAGGDHNMTVRETAYTVKRRFVGKQSTPKSRRAETDYEAEIDIDPEGKYECWERTDNNVSTYQGTGPDGPDWLKVWRRLTWDVDANELIGDELGETILTDAEIYAPLPEGVRNVRTRLYYERDDGQHEDHA